MRFLKITKLFYQVYTVYTFLIMLISDYPAKYALSGLTVIWLMYAMVLLGYKSAPNRQKRVKEYQEEEQGFLFSSIPNWNVFQYFINGVVCWACTILTSQFYTGKGVVQVIDGFLGSGNAYRAYQAYFSSANIAAFTLRKIPYILMLAYLTIMLFWSVISIVQLTPKIKIVQYIYVASIVLSYLYFGVARGTNFELYTVFILLAYCFLNRQRYRNGAQKLNYKNLIIVGVLGCILVYLFLTIVGARGGTFSYEICGEIQYNPQSFLAKLFPDLSVALKSLFSYLGFGIYTIGVSFFDIIPQNISSAITVLFPGYELFNGVSIVSQLSNTIDLGVRWVPDILLMLDGYGFIISMIAFFVIGRIASKVQTKNIPVLLKELITVILYVQMLSFPVGNFLWVSTPNAILVIFVCLCMLQTRVRIIWPFRR